MGAENPFKARDVTSRRGGPVKAPLSRELIVATALELLKRDGVEGMRLRKVAAALDTGAASLYAYVDDSNALRALVLDRALGAVNIRGTKEGWRESVRALLSSYVKVLSDTPGLGQLALNTIAVGPNALRIFESLLRFFHEGEMDRGRAAWAVDLVLLYCTAIAAEHGNGVNPGHPEGPLVPALRGAPEEDFPMIHASREELVAGTGEERVSWCIDVMLNGVLMTARPPPSKDSRELGPRAGTRKKRAR
jgi:AcrR family transcriptional regulator